VETEQIKQWLDLIHGGGDLALAVGLYFANKIAKSVMNIAHSFEEMHDDIRYIRERTEKNTVRLERIYGSD